MSVVHFCAFVNLVTETSSFKGSVRDHCFPAPFSWFLHKTGLESLKITSACCFLLKCQRKDSKKSERTPPVSWRPWALACNRDWPYNFSCLSAMSKNGCLRSFFSGLGRHLARKSLLWPATPVSSKKQESVSSENESNCSMTSEGVRTDSILPPRRRPRARSMSNSRFSRFQFLAFWSNGLASSIFIFASILLRFFIFYSSMQGLKYSVTDFLISTSKKVMLRQSRPGRVKQRFWRFFVHILTSRVKLKIL